MKIRGVDFDFSGLRASDVRRMGAAQKASAKETADAKNRNQEDMAAVIQGQCDIIVHFLDTVLGPGACDKLGVATDDLVALGQLMEDFGKAITAEREAFRHRFPGGRK